MHTDLEFLSATEALKAFSAGTLTPPDLLEAVLAASERQQGPVNAATAIHADEARAQARESARRWREGTARALEGVPVIIKEETSVRGWRGTFGSLLHDDVGEEDAPIVERLRAAGAVFHFQATTPEFCCLGHTWSKRWGVTRNPWNLAMSCGGSSGGSGAALAAGCGPLATGSDMAGSIRIPAALCGLYGFKPPFGRVAPSPGDELFAFAVEGPMARSFDDLLLMQRVLAGPHPSSYLALPDAPLPTQWGDSLRGVRIAYSPALGAPRIERDILANMERSLHALEARGAEIVPVDIAWDHSEVSEALMEGILALYYEEALEQIPPSDRARLCSYNQAMIEKYLGKPNSLEKAATLAARLHRDLVDKVWGRGCHALVCAATLRADYTADQDPATQPTIDVEGQPVDAFLGWALTPAFNLLSRYPVMAVPTGLAAASGVPTSMQIVGAPHDDATVFRIAHHHDAAGSSPLFRRQFPRRETMA
jgi:Asp-tRNA(Asn)/Glu-tRNA(Gln) amidotransferase A subunit family amidase